MNHSLRNVVGFFMYSSQSKHHSEVLESMSHPKWNVCNQGGFQLLDLIIPELKSHVIPYKFKPSHWLKLQYSYLGANLVKDLFLQIIF